MRAAGSARFALFSLRGGVAETSALFELRAATDVEFVLLRFWWGSGGRARSGFGEITRFRGDKPARREVACA